jgi:phosphatidylglycerol:prolipoprotein diacylglycerol transferase
MLPYIELKTLQLGPLTLQVWGIMVALGCLLGALTAARFAKRNELKSEVIFDAVSWIVGFGIIGARLGFVFFYDITTFIQKPLNIFAIWDGGMSMFGGLVGGALAGIVYFRHKQLDVWAYSEACIFGLPVGMWIGRIGCFLIHDHPGTATDFFLGIEYPDGVTRHDHGLYLSLNGLLMAIVFYLLAKKKRPVGTYISVFLIWYGTVRFYLDFYRVGELTILGLKPGQYFALLSIIGGVFIWKKFVHDRH